MKGSSLSPAKLQNNRGSGFSRDSDLASAQASPGATIASQTSSLDIHALSYIPLWLRAVNESIAVPIFCSLLETINFPNYINCFAGRQYLEPLKSVKLPIIKNVPVVHSASTESLTSEAYATYFSEALQNEISAEHVELQHLSIFMAAVELHDPSQHLFRLQIPGLREDSPRIDLGDVLLVRPLFHRPDLPKLTNMWYEPGGGKEKGFCAPGFAGLEYRAVVWGVARPEEEIILRIDGLTQLKCNIIFAVQEHRIAPIVRAITFTNNCLRASHLAMPISGWLRRNLFPTVDDGVMQFTLPQGTFPKMIWIDTQLNYEQQKAVNAVYRSSYGNVPYLVSGPPGTGKTKTIVETTLQLLCRSQRLANSAPHILLCAPSNPAADTLASRLARQLTPTELFRLNGCSRSFSEVPSLLLPYSFVDKDLFSLPSFETLMTYKVVVTTCRDADMLVQARLTNQALGHLTRSTLRAVAPGAYAAVTESQMLHWTALLIDEAAQATEPEALIPITVIAPPADAPAESEGQQPLPQLIMAGDEHQLGPRLFSSSSSALSTSLFARLFSRAFYAQHPLSRERGSQRLTASMLPMRSPAFTNLIRNYRSHPSILSIPSQLFYNDTLVPESTAISDVVRTWPGWKAPHSWPVLFVQNTTSDSVECILSGNGTGAAALFNHGEAVNALLLVQELLEHHAPNNGAGEKIRQDEIAVISPFRAQVHLLRKIFRKGGLGNVNIGPLEAFQGLESRVIVLCTTRTRRGIEGESAARFVREDRERGLGVIGEPKRFNVAITRAKEALIVFGDPETLTVEEDPCWKAFISFCARNGCLVHESHGKASDLSWVEKFNKSDAIKEGRLEKALVFAANMSWREFARDQQKGFGYPDPPETRRRRKFSLKGQMPTMDNELWKARLKVGEEMDESTLLEDGDVDQTTDHVKDEDPDPWNSDRYLTDGNEHLTGQESCAGSLVEASLSVTAGMETGEISKNHAVLPSETVTEYDLDPKAEFERTDCATQ